MIRKTLPLLMALCTSGACQAAQVKQAKDGATIEAVIAKDAPTRIRIQGEQIVDVVGNVYSSSGCDTRATDTAGQVSAPPLPTPATNVRGDVMLSCDLEKGEVYVRPVGVAEKPISLFIASRRATYTLLLRRADITADTIIIEDRSLKVPVATTGDRTQRPEGYVRALKAMLAAMVSERPSKEFHVEPIDQQVTLWQEAQFKLVRLVEGRGLLGEMYSLTNVSAAPMVLAEQEFDREEGGVVAVAIEHHNLAPQDSTTVYVIRTSGELP